jgi:transposase
MAGVERADLAGDVLTAIDNAQIMAETGQSAEGTGRPENDEQKAKRIEALTYRLAGYSYEQISKTMGQSVNHIKRLIDYSLQNGENRAVEQLRELENLRLDRLQAAHWAKALEGDDKSTSQVLKISQQRARINGLYAPTKIEMAVGIKQEMEIALRDLETLMGQTQQEMVVLAENTQGELEADNRYVQPEMEDVWSSEDSGNEVIVEPDAEPEPAPLRGMETNW